MDSFLQDVGDEAVRHLAAVAAPVVAILVGALFFVSEGAMQEQRRHEVEVQVDPMALAQTGHRPG